MAEAMLVRPKLHSPRLTIDQARAAFGDGHIHMLLLVGDSRLVATVERDDLITELHGESSAVVVGRTAGRTTTPTTRLGDAFETMRSGGRRRLAVVGDDLTVLGLLCLKVSLDGFCSDADIERRGS